MTHRESTQTNLVARESLPIATQRWLDRSLPGDPYLPASIQINQEGSMEIRAKWTPFKASGVYKASPLSFDWQARLQMLPGVWIVAKDGHLDGQGWGSASLWGVIPMGKSTDPEVLTTQLVRNLGELVWLPWFVLADSSLAWTGAGETAFEVRSSAGGQEVDEESQENPEHHTACIADIADCLRSRICSCPYGGCALLLGEVVRAGQDCSQSLR